MGIFNGIGFSIFSATPFPTFDQLERNDSGDTSLMLSFQDDPYAL
jgi:hypothetical protein